MSFSPKANYRGGNVIMTDNLPVSAVAAGDVIVIGGNCRVAHRPSTLAADGVTYNQMALSIGYGIYDVVKSAVASVSFADGDNVYWNAGTSLATATSSDTWMGFAIGAAGTTAGTVRVALYPTSVTGSSTTVSGAASVGSLSSSGAIAGAAGLTTSGPTGAGLGYATGAGGAVSQATDRTTGVTLNKLTGAITTQATSLAAAAIVSFTVTNSTVAIGDTIILSIRSGPTTVGTIAYVTTVAAGSFQITLKNGHASTADIGAAIINFAVLKAVSA